MTTYFLVKHLNLGIATQSNEYTIHILCEYIEEESFNCNIDEILRYLRDHCNLAEADLELTWNPQNRSKEKWTVELTENHDIFLKYYPMKESLTDKFLNMILSTKNKKSGWLQCTFTHSLPLNLSGLDPANNRIIINEISNDNNSNNDTYIENVYKSFLEKTKTKTHCIILSDHPLFLIIIKMIKTIELDDQSFNIESDCTLKMCNNVNVNVLVVPNDNEEDSEEDSEDEIYSKEDSNESLPSTNSRIQREGATLTKRLHVNFTKNKQPCKNVTEETKERNKFNEILEPIIKEGIILVGFLILNPVEFIAYIKKYVNNSKM
jgi:hypothetical protein